MRTSDIRPLSTAELGGRLDEAYHELFNLRVQVSTGQQRNTARLTQLRRDIARLKTELRSRELAAFRGQTEG